MERQLELFMTALPAQVRLEKTPDSKTMLRGLPVLRPGTWNGRTYSAADLEALARNFGEIRESDSWEPPLRPYHLLDADGHPARLDARETLAWHRALHWDPAAGLLTADLEIVDADTVSALEAGKLRYVSAEIVRSGYASPVTGKTYDTPVYYGAAFVDNPAVKGMPWQLVVNAEEHCGRQAAAAKDGERQMSWLETLKGLLRREGVADEELAAVDQLAVRAVTAAEGEGGEAEEGGAEGGAGRTAEVEQLLQTVREQQEALAEAQEACAALRRERVREAAEGTVDRLVSEGTLPPALRAQCLALVSLLAEVEAGAEGEGGGDGEVEMLTAGGEGAEGETAPSRRDACGPGGGTARGRRDAGAPSNGAEGETAPSRRDACGPSGGTARGRRDAEECMRRSGPSDGNGGEGNGGEGNGGRGVELLREVLRGVRPRLFAPASELWQGTEALGESRPLSDAELDKIAALAGGTPKGEAN